MQELSAMATHVASVMTPLQFTVVNANLGEVALLAGIPIDQMRFVVCLFLAYPLAMVHRVVRTPALKHWINIAVGIIMAQFVYGPAWMHSFLSALVTYCIIKFAPVRYAPYASFAFNMVFVAGLHIHRMLTDYMGWSMDSTGSQMLLLIKLTSFGFNVYDGMVPASSKILDTDSPQTRRVKQTRKELAVTTMPSLLEFFGYVYSFTTFLAGPSFEYREYIDSVQATKFMLKGERREPSGMAEALTKFAIGAFFMALLAQFGYLADLPAILRMNQSVSKRFARVLLALFLTRSRYYCAWKLAEGSTILAGFGFEGFRADGTPRGWNGVSNVDILGFELAHSVRDMSRAWNKGTQLWLERYVYCRTGNSLMATYMCSAVWHGFYPGYYLFFLTIPFVTSINRLARKHIRPYFLRDDGSASPSKLLYDVFGMVCTLGIVNYLAVSFVVLSWEQALSGFQAMHFAGHISLVVVYLLLSAVPVKKKVLSFLRRY
ncbi:TPA: hypothetical protein N0F65_004512 [Lagenidium giganteum]|uniref:Lysophospholipid acyltransferase n=1 Tax=Lagenidium giganteum TaxID=4803 RepID=A0AAV2YXX3_9STRA|nr:TPA: hypothetical protein N0F65_004512 [Lagenidium giganteum]